MSRIENPFQSSTHMQQLLHLTCGKCGAVINYRRGTKWDVVNALVNAHMNNCPERPEAAAPRTAAITPTSNLPSGTGMVPPPLEPSQQLGSAEPAAPPNPHNMTWIAAGCKRKHTKLEERKRELEQDEYALAVTSTSVVCGGCHKKISLDKRSLYYPGLWRKHREKCPAIKKLAKGKGKARQTGYDIGMAMSRNGNSRDAAQLGREEPSQMGETSRTILHDDAEDPPSSETEEDEELPPFPMSNDRFFWTQPQHERNQWAYRYATKEEIDTNFFRRQNVPYTPAEN